MYMRPHTLQDGKNGPDERPRAVDWDVRSKSSLAIEFQNGTLRNQRTLTLNAAYNLLVEVHLSWRNGIIYGFLNLHQKCTNGGLHAIFLNTEKLRCNIKSEPWGHISASLASWIFSHLKSAAVEAFQGSLNAMRMWSIKNAGFIGHERLLTLAAQPNSPVFSLSLLPPQPNPNGVMSSYLWECREGQREV